MSACKIHNVRFYRPQPEAIHCMAFEENSCRLAVGRSNCTIDIWNLNDAPFIERTFPLSANNTSIEDIAWHRNRLFSVGLHGFLVEYDLRTLSKKHLLSVTGEAAYCIDIHSATKQIAVGTEQGYLNIFKITPDEVMFSKFLDKQEGRILCLKYDSTGNFIASGSMDTVRVWDVTTGHAMHRMTTGRLKSNVETVVWSVNILDDLTIVSGDSRGKITFWDGKIGSQLESYQSHRADVLAVAVSKDQKTLYCAGVDPNIVSYVKIHVKDDMHRWVKSVQRKIHDHDVRDLVLHDKKLYSGGLDGYLCCSYHPPKTLLKYPPLLQNPCVTLSRKSRFILLRYPTRIELWALGESGNARDGAYNNGLLPLAREPKKLLLLDRSAKDDFRGDVKEGIVCSAVSENGRWIVFSTDSALRVFCFKCAEEGLPTLYPVEDLPPEVGPALQTVFTPNDSQLIVSSRHSGLQVLELRNGAVGLSQQLDSSMFEDAVTLLTVSPDNRYLVAADIASNIMVWVNQGHNTWEKRCKLPKCKSAPTDISVQPHTPILVVVYASQKIVEFDLRRQEFTKFSRSLDKDNVNKLVHKSYPIRNICFDPRKKQLLILHDDTSLIVINKEKKLPNKDSKIPRLDSSTLSSDSNDSQSKTFNHGIHAIKKYKHLVYFDWLSENEMVAVEVNPLSLIEQLPPCMQQSTFGTK